MTAMGCEGETRPRPARGDEQARAYRPWLRQRLTTRPTIASSSPVWRQSSEKSGSDEAGRRSRSRSSNETRIGIETPSPRSEEHTSELQSQSNLVCRLLLEKKKKRNNTHQHPCAK